MLRLKFAQKISFSIFVLIVFFGGFATVSTFFLTRSVLNGMILDRMSNLGPFRSFVIGKAISKYKDVVHNAATQNEVVGYVEKYGNSKDKSEFDISILKELNVNDSTSAIYILNNKGVVIFSTDPRLLNQDYSFRDYYLQASEGNSYVDVALGVTTNELGYYFSHPIYSSKTPSKIIGVMVFKLKPEVMKKEFFSLSPVGYQLSLIDNFGVVVASTDLSKNYKSLSTLSELSQKKILETKKFGSELPSTLDYSELMNKLSDTSTNSSEIISLYDNDEKREEEVSLLKVPDAPFYLMVEGDTKLINQQSFGLALVIAGFVWASAFFALIMINVLISKLLLPLNEIISFTKDIGEGKTVNKIEVKSNDEMGKLAETINEMSNQIGQYKNSMEKKVEERTVEIEKTMDAMLGRELKMIELKREISSFKNGKQNDNL